MKNKLWTSGWLELFLVAGMCGFVVPAFSGAPPLTEEFLEATLPSVPFSFSSSSEGRIELVGDSSDTVLELVPPGYFSPTWYNGASRLRGNLYRCDTTEALCEIGMTLGRSQTTEITFVIYEATTNTGPFSLIASNVVSVTAGTNLVQSGEINTVLKAGNYYVVGAAWDQSVQYSSGGTHPVSTSFGQSLNGCSSSGYPPAQTISSPYFNNMVYPQQLTTASNLVVRMDDSVYGSLTSTNSMDLFINLEDYTDVTLEFRHRASGEESNPADGIFLSNDSGNNFTKIYTLDNGTTGWQNLVLDIDALAAESGLSLTANTVIRFQQADNCYWPADGREFDDIRVYSLPDLKAVSLKSGGNAPISKLWKGFSSPKQIPLEFLVESRGGNTDFSYPTIEFVYDWEDSGGTPRWNADEVLPWSIDAMEVSTDTLTPTLILPASMHLPDLNYTIHAYIDTQDDMEEALENNNEATLSVTVNHYSGSLWFNDIKTDITITDWGTRVANSTTDHWITGTGTLNGHFFSFTHLDVVKNLTSLDYSIDPAETAKIAVSFPERYSVNDVSYWHDSGVELSRAGAYADIKVLLPAGCGINTGGSDKMLLEPTIIFPNKKLLQALYPAGPVTLSGTFEMTEETKPLAFDVSDVTWNPQTGTFSFNATGVGFVRESYYDQLESQAGNLINSAMARKKSNAAYYRAIDGLDDDPVIHAGSNGEALMDAYLTFQPGQMEPHFPYGPLVVWNDGFRMSIRHDLLIPTEYPMKSFDPIELYFGRNCGGTCGGNALMGQMDLYEHDAGLLDPNGGLRIPVSISNGTLEWGARQDNTFAQQTEAFPAGTFYMPGTFIRGDQSAFQASENKGPAEILLVGIKAAGTSFERPGQPNYSDGLADYAGVNLRVSVAGDLPANSVLGGTETGSWDLTARSKYYVRYSGVSGIHEAVPGSFPDTLKIYDYNFGFSNFGLSYLSNKPKHGCSRINGDVTVPDPCNIDMLFEDMNLCCLGELEDADLANSDSKTLRYWDAEIQPLSLFFAPTAASTCTDSARKLCMGLTTRCANFDRQLSGVLAFMPGGGLGTPADQVEGVPSRLSVPNEIEFDGPASETYYYNPVAMPYYNDYTASGDTMAKRGWINFAGNLDVAFFDDLQVHLHTSASTNGGTSASIYMMGGWSTAGSPAPTFFNSDPDGFDINNVGFPSVVSYDDYRNPSTDTYRVRARRNWFNVVDFDYPLDWSSASKSFKSPDTVTNDLLVLKVQHQTDYLSAENTEISFGMQYDGLPQVNLANMAFNALNEATGMSAAFTDSVGDMMRDTIDTGMGAFSDTLSDLPDQLLGPVLDPILDSLIDDFYTDIYAAYSSAPGTDYYSAVITNYIYGAIGGSNQNVQHVLKNLDNSLDASTDLLAQINTNLDRAVSMIDAFTSVVTTDTNGIALPGGSQVVGLLNLDSGSYDQLTSLGIGILKNLATTLYDSVKNEVQTKLNEQLESVKPTLSSISQTLLDLRSTITNVQAQLTMVSNLGNELHGILNSPEMQNPLQQMDSAMNSWFAALPNNGNLLSEYSPEEVKAMLRNQIKDAFYGSLPCADIQQMVRSRLYEVEASIEESIDSAYQQLNKAMRDFISQYVSQLDDKINGALGDLGGSIGAGQIDGYAHIRNDSLTELRLDGKFQWSVPKKMDFNAYMVIKQLDSKQAGACGMAGAKLPEVTVGTTDMKMDMMKSTIRADIAVKISFISTNLSGTAVIYPIGMGGSFNMKEGKIGFESFAITKLYAAVAFGALENYISAAIHCNFTDYEVEGGIFLGKTCTLDPFSWDPDVQGILGDPPFTGIYVYGQGWIPVPIVDYGCMLQIRVGVGAGIFAFLEGPIGGKIYMGLDGTALCVVNVGAEVVLVGVKDGDDLRMKGKGTVRGRVGACPFCIKFSKTVGVKYDNGDWDVDL